MENTQIRDARRYFGLVKPFNDESTGLVIENAFLVADNISILDWKISWHYQVFASVQAFDAGKESIKHLERQFWLEAEFFDVFKTEHEALFAALDTRFRGLVYPAPTAEAQFESAVFKTLDYKLSINFTDGDEFPARSLAGETYHQMIADNIDVVSTLIPILHTVGATKDAQFFNGASLLLPE